MRAAPLARVGMLTALFVSCVSEDPAHRSMVRFLPQTPIAIEPERVAGTDRGDYALVYGISDDGASIRTQFKGPSEALTAGFVTVSRANGDEHVLYGRIGRSEYRVPIAKWRVDARGKVVDAWVPEPQVAETPAVNAPRTPAEG